MTTPEQPDGSTGATWDGEKWNEAELAWSNGSWVPVAEAKDAPAGWHRLSSTSRAVRLWGAFTAVMLLTAALFAFKDWFWAPPPGETASNNYASVAAICLYLAAAGAIITILVAIFRPPRDSG